VNLAQLRSLAASTGFPDPDLAAAVAMAESKGNPSATAIVTDPAPGNGPERSFGLWQINTLAHPSYNEEALLDANYNAQAAFAISQGGTNWTPWSTYTHGLYLKFYSGKLLFGLARSTWLAIAIGAAGSLIIYSELYGVPKPLRELRKAF
jgi:lysozyme-like protein